MCRLWASTKTLSQNLTEIKICFRKQSRSRGKQKSINNIQYYYILYYIIILCIIIIYELFICDADKQNIETFAERCDAAAWCWCRLLQKVSEVFSSSVTVLNMY